MQGRTTDTDIENVPVDTAVEGKGRMKERSPGTHRLPYAKQRASGKLLWRALSPGAVTTLGVGWGGVREAWGRGGEGTRVYLTAGSHGHTAETSTIL